MNRRAVFWGMAAVFVVVASLLAMWALPGKDEGAAPPEIADEPAPPTRASGDRPAPVDRTGPVAPAPAGGEPANEADLRVSGRVLYATTGAPVAGAAVTATPDRGKAEPVEAVADAEGRYEVTGLRPHSRYALTACEVSRGLAPKAPAVVTLEDASVEGVELYVVEGGEVSGVVTVLETREPVGEARVTAKFEGAGPVCRETRSDGRGRFTLAAVPAGRIEIACPSQECDVLTREGYCRASLEGGAEILELRLGEQRGQVHLTMSQGTTVSGRVCDTSGRGIEGALVRGSAYDIAVCPPTRETTTDGSGRYLLTRLEPAAKYVCRASAEGFAGMEVHLEPRLPEEGIRGLDFVLEQGATISGWARQEDGTRIAGRILVLSGPEGYEYKGWKHSVSSVLTKTGTDGEFTFVGVAPGEHLFALNDQGDASPHPRNHPTISVRSGEVIRGLELVFEAARFNNEIGPFIAGRVFGSDGEPINAWVCVATDEVGNPRNTVTDAEGWFRLGSLGDLSGTTAQLLVRPFFERVLRPSAPTIVVVPVGTEDLEVRLPRAATITGTVRDAQTGEPIAGACVKVLRLSVNGASVEYLASGELRSEGLPPGQYILEGVGPGLVKLWTTVQGADYRVQESEDIEVAEGATISGVDFYLERRAE